MKRREFRAAMLAIPAASGAGAVIPRKHGKPYLSAVRHIWPCRVSPEEVARLFQIPVRLIIKLDASEFYAGIHRAEVAALRGGRR